MSWRTFVIGLLACALGACALLRSKEETLSTPLPATSHERAERRLAPLAFGRHAHFAECIEPGCPSRTPKTVAATAAPASQPVAALEPPHLRRPSSARLPVTTDSPPASVKTTGQRLTLLFALGSSTLTGEHRTRLRRALPDLRHSDRIVVAGRTDDLGSESLNQSLALARGLAVRDYLLDLDPQLPGRIAIDARGRCCYAAPNINERSRSLNRRVEVAYAGDSGAAP
ncbi:MAG: OmpA family protein [Burkholderiales bacterium]|nr:OmpA family protein [Burkholderiales bacterium]